MSELTVEEVPKLKVTELKTELAARDLPTKGRKQELAERLVEHLQGGESQEQSQDPAGQTSGEAPQLADAAQANTESLPSEMPAVPPANEDSVQDLEGAEPKLSETAAANGVETAQGQSEVVRPDVNSLDQTPGVVSSSGADTNGSADVGEKRKRDDEPASEPAVLPLNAAPESVAAQAETAEPGNDSVPAPPVDVEEPDTKRLKTDDDSAAAAGSADIPVPSASGDATSDIPVPSQGGADASASLLAPQADPILPLNEAIVPNTSNAVPSGSEDPTKSQQPPIA